MIQTAFNTRLKLTDENRSSVDLLLEMVSGVWISRIIYTAAKLGLADLLSQGPKNSEELARETKMDPDALYRVLRALVSLGIFVETEGRAFELNEMGGYLKTGSETLRAFILMMGETWQMRTWERMMYSVESGQPTFDKAIGTSMWEYFSKHPLNAQIFDEAMTSFTANVVESVLDKYDFSTFETIIDVGAGSGYLLSAILKHYPEAEGVIFDLPAAVKSARKWMEQEALTERCRFVTGDCLKFIPNGGDIYLMKHLLHLFQDDMALKILHNVRNSMAHYNKLLILEMVIPPTNERFYGKLMDVMMLVGTGGRDRTEDEYRALLTAGGFEITQMIPTASPVSIIECMPH
jgi:ubiquinone/menaquinone biosynthesis C-methylase UbiE